MICFFETAIGPWKGGGTCRLRRPNLSSRGERRPVIDDSSFHGRNMMKSRHFTKIGFVFSERARRPWTDRLPGGNGDLFFRVPHPAAEVARALEPPASPVKRGDSSIFPLAKQERFGLGYAWGQTPAEPQSPGPRLDSQAEARPTRRRRLLSWAAGPRGTPGRRASVNGVVRGILLLA
jgi:hypothetical protein